MPHMTKSIVLNNDGQNEIQMPAILIVQVLKKKINKFDAVEKIIKLCHFELSGTSWINYYTNFFKISPYGLNGWWISDFLRDGKIWEKKI